MASVTKNGSNWRAQVYVKGVRTSKTFSTKSAATAWASQKELELNKDMEVKASFTEKFGNVSNMLTLSAEEILAGKVRLCNTSAVYLLFNGNELVYIGKSTNALSRIVEHAKKGRAFTHYYTLPVHESLLDAVEQKMIDIFRPEQNITHNSDHGLRSIPPIPSGTPMAIKSDWLNQFASDQPDSTT